MFIIICMKIDIGEIKYIKFPDLILDKQDTSDEYGYHWKDLKTHEKEVKCVLIAIDKYAYYYMPLYAPYKLCKEHNNPNSIGSYIVKSSYKENFELQSFLPDGYFMPFKEFIEEIPSKNWLKVYLKIIENDPSKIDSLIKFNFWLTDTIEEPIKYKHTWKTHDVYELQCFPFKNLCKKGKNIKYSHYIGYKNGKDQYEYLNCNIERLNVEYDDTENGGILPIVRIEKEKMIEI